MKLTLPFGNKKISFDADEKKIIFYGERTRLDPVKNIKETLSALLRSPIGSEPLYLLAEEKKKVLFVVEDITRATPLEEIVPVVADELNRAGVEDSSITLLTAPGTHRVMTASEMREKYGTLLDRFIIIQHDATDASLIADLGTITAGGYSIPLHVNKALTEADLIIGFGSIVPHCNAGYSGGGKIILPGVCDFASTSAAHAAAAFCDDIPLGRTEGNPCREAIDAAAQRAGLSFIVNTVLDENNVPVGIFAGAPVPAHREGVKLSEKTFSTEIPGRADIVIASSYPADLDYWQGGKGLSAASFAVKRGGIIILLSSCREGMAENHDLYREYLRMKPEELMTFIRATDPRDTEADIVAAAVAAENHKILAGTTVFIVSEGLSDENVSALGFERFASAEEALAEAEKRIKNATVGLLPYGGTTIPVIRK